ncbi:Tfp pilus assembly protein FimT/FimU [Planctomycetota bacterium]
MTRTCSAQTHANGVSRISYLVSRNRSGFTLTELVIATVLLSLFVAMAQMNLFGLLTRGKFKSQVQDFVLTLQMAVNAASQSDRRYEVIIDLAEQNYMLREFTSLDFTEVFEEDIIAEGTFGSNCFVDYVLFDDMIETDEEHLVAIFRVSRAGWQNGGRIVLLDEDDRPYTIIINRMDNVVTLEQGDIEMMWPKRKDEVWF